MPLIDDLQITLKDFLPNQSDGKIITDRGRGTTTTVSSRLCARLRAYADENKLPLDGLVERLREEIHRGTAADADDLAYFTGVLKRLDALSNRVTDDSVLTAMATEAKLYVGALIGCLIPESEDASTVGRREPVRSAAVKDDLAVTQAAAAAIDAFTGLLDQQGFRGVAAELRRRVKHHGVREVFVHLQDALDRNAWPS